MLAHEPLPEPYATIIAIALIVATIRFLYQAVMCKIEFRRWKKRRES